MIRRNELEGPAEATQAECRRLREENARLRAMLGIPVPTGYGAALHAEASAADTKESLVSPPTPEEKIALFQSLFRGRQDV